MGGFNYPRIVSVGVGTLLVLGLNAVFTPERTRAASLTVTDFTASSYTLGQTGVTYTVTLTVPVDETSLHIGLGSMTAGAGQPTQSFCNATLTSVTDDGANIIGNLNFQKDTAGGDGLCYGYTLAVTSGKIDAGSTVVVAVANAINPTAPGAYYPNINDNNGNSIPYYEGLNRPFGTPLIKAKVTAPNGTTAIPRAYLWVRTSDNSVSGSGSTGPDGIAYLFDGDFYGSASHDNNYNIDTSPPGGDSDYTPAMSLSGVALAIGSTADFTQGPLGPIKLTTPQIKGTLRVPNGCATCTAEAGAAIPYVTVEVQDSNRDPLKFRMAQADYNGVFRIGQLTAGTYTMYVHSVYDSLGQYNGLVPPTTTPQFTVNANGSVTYNSVTTPAGSLPVNLGNIEFGLATKTISGKVKDEANTGIAGVVVQASKAMGMSMVMGQATTAGDGSYSLLVGGGSWQLSPQQGMSQNWVYCGMSQTAVFADNTNPESLTNKDITVKATTGTITGKLVKPDSSPATGGGVSIFSKDGCGAYAQLDFVTGTFSAKVPAGSYTVSVGPMMGYGAPSPVAVTVGTGTVDVGTLALTAHNAVITGRLWYDSNHNQSFDAGEGVGNIRVQAVKGMAGNATGGAGEMVSGTSSNNSADKGAFALNVAKGSWTLNVMADPGMMNGGYSTTSVNYLYTGSPTQINITAETQESSGNNFELEAADATITGRMIDATTEDPITGIYGFAFAEPSGTYNQGAMMGAGMGTQISNGVFTLKVPAGEYKVGVDFPPETMHYTPASMATVTAISGETVSLDVPVAPNDATIRISFKDQGGNAVTNLAFAQIMADNGNGGHQFKQFFPVDLENGYVELTVSAGIWRVGYYIDPTTNNYMSETTADNKVTAISGQTVNKEITLRVADSTVSGTVYDPDGDPLAGVWVSTDNRKASNYASGPMFTNGATTGADGTYSLKLPAGTYKVSASFPPSAVVGGVRVSYLNPDAKEVTVSAASPATTNFTFGRADATISGTVTLNGTAQSAFISAYSDSGGYNETSTTNGTYSLNVTKDDTWYLRAVYESGTSIYNSSIYKVAMEGATSKSQDLPLNAASFTLPPAVSTTFSCANAKKITLTNGTEISIPAAAIQPSSVSSCSSEDANSDITVSVEATAQLSLQEKSIPVGVGYEISAVDSGGNTISDTFNSNVTITIPYSETEITNAVGSGGVSDANLGNGYWDTSTSAWRSVTDQVLDGDNNTLSISTSHFTLFSVIATTDPTTVTGTGRSNSNANSASNNSSSGGGGSSGCGGDAKPSSTPDLFQVNVTSTTSKLFFTPIGNTTTFYVSFHTTPTAEGYGETVTLAREGVQSHQIYFLKPNTRYYAKVRGQNGCTSGDWSNVIAFNTRPKGVTKAAIFYKGSIKLIGATGQNYVRSTTGVKKQPTAVSKNTTVTGPATVAPANQGVVAPAPQPNLWQKIVNFFRGK